MATIEEVRTILQARHLTIAGVKTAPVYPPQKIETAHLPAVFLRTATGEWQHEHTGNLEQTRTFLVEVLLQPLPQNLFAVNERLIDQMIQSFGKHYHDNCQVGPNVWLQYNSTSDGGWQVIQFGTEYVGFIFEIQVRIGEE